MQRHLTDNYPSASLPLSDTSSNSKKSHRILTREKKELDSSDEDLSEDEDISSPNETEDSSTRHDGYVRQLKGMPMFNPTKRRHAVSAPCLYVLFSFLYSTVKRHHVVYNIHLYPFFTKKKKYSNAQVRIKTFK